MTTRRNIIGIGGSAGGLPAVIDLLKHFEPVRPAIVLLVLHRVNETGHLVEILRRSTSLRVCEPHDGEPLRDNCLYIAPPDEHLLLGEGHLHLRRGPRENNFRPAIDPMFRSLAVLAGARATGVILSGYLDDGAAGARAIVAAGGHVMVQDPASAASPDMPHAAISAVGEPENIAPPAALGRALSRAVGAAAGPDGTVSEAVKLELMVAGLERASMTTEDRLGELSPYNCPDCNGVLWQIEDGPLVRFRCHTGHAYSSASLDARQEEMLERSLYDSLRSLREKARLLRDMAGRDPASADRLCRRADDYDRDGDHVEAMILARQKRAA
ncbi:chemotaxis protein CheB [Croceicoccus hydrothermalis]|uniref:chemotaxis protein CheB n=1 Tax=Croceicoccus hydrothermalis TaxID=2867964 RepID=UPI001EFB73CA|nr:chemotaxis protein CheB [Croceicoccus hydrothermalis]